jgi:methionyl-tRNA formyltransferase
MPVVFFGTPAFAIPSLRALIESGEKIEAVVTRPDAPKGRDRAPSAPPVKELALKHGLRVLQPRSMKDEGFVKELRDISPEFLVVVAYGRILTREIIGVPTVAPVNVHASLLPRYRGASPIAWAIINGDAETGVTTQIIKYELDTGDILLQEKTGIADEDTTETLSERLSVIGADLLVRTIKGLRDGTITPFPQAGEPTYAPPLKKEDGLMNWNRTARELFNFARGMHPWPGAYSFLHGERLRLAKVGLVPGEGAPGRIAKAEGDELLVGTGEGLLSIIELQPEGKRPMAARAFLQGRDVVEGDVFTDE